MNHIRFASIFLFVFVLAPFSGTAQDVTPYQILTPVPSGDSILAKLYREEAPKVVYVTGINVNPTLKSPNEFFNPPNGTKEEHTVGTGFILHPDGYIVTNAHAVNRTILPEVELISGRRYPAEVIDIIAEEDLALLKIEPEEPLSAVQIEPVPEVSIGDTVVLIGCPHALKFSLTYGIVSGTDRISNLTDIPGLTLKGLLQTDAAINPGSSGGPWFNLFGKVMGMTVSKRGDSDGIAFGISLETICCRFPEMLHRAASKRWELPLTVTASRKSDPHRTRIGNLTPEFAQKWGLQEGDLIQKINGTETFTAVDYYQTLLSLQTGSEVKLLVFRENEPESVKEVSFQLEERAPRNIEQIVSNRLHMKVKELTPKDIEDFHLRFPRGVLLTEVDASRFKHLKHAPRSGDILARVNNERPESPAHLAEILENISPESTLDLVILRRPTGEQNASFTRIDINNLSGK
ncbi:MAG: trypsin-like peptidase domain-containing protein [Thermoguttaceae bacterium]|nr:trypsin-like peptidase domain-containing protein [Thermoguttaceae bacterium]